MTRVKICGLTNPGDAELAIRFGADALGFVQEPSSPRYTDAKNAEWIRRLPPFCVRVAVFGPVPDDPFLDPFHAAQFTDRIAPLRRRTTWRSVRLRPGLSVRDVIKLAHLSDVLVLDAFSEAAYGGTGETVDWDFAAEVVACTAQPVVLAGGLTPDNVAQAVQKVRPYAVDVSSGVEARPGEKDLGKLRDFIAAAKGA